MNNDIRAEAHRENGGFNAAPIAALVIFVIALLMTIMALNFGREARRVPLVIGIPLVVLAGLDLAKEGAAFLRRRRGVADDIESRKSKNGFVFDAEELVRRTMEENAGEEAIAGMPFKVALFMLAVLVVLFVVLGQVASTPVFLVVALRIFNKQPWRRVIITAVVMTAFMYCMTVFLGLPSYEGILPQYWPWLGEVLR